MTYDQRLKIDSMIDQKVLGLPAGEVTARWSIDRESALELVDLIHQKGTFQVQYDNCRPINKPGKHEYSATVYNADGDKQVAQAIEDSLAFAICVALLEAVGEKVPSVS
jgi:L-ascorbate metabolism protein UlaG (beta-lactamase superfamily)